MGKSNQSIICNMPFKILYDPFLWLADVWWCLTRILSLSQAFILQEQLEIKNNTIKRLKLGMSMPEEKLEQQQPNHVATGINANLPVK